MKNFTSLLRSCDLGKKSTTHQWPLPMLVISIWKSTALLPLNCTLEPFKKYCIRLGIQLAYLLSYLYFSNYLNFLGIFLSKYFECVCLLDEQRLQINYNDYMQYDMMGLFSRSYHAILYSYYNCFIRWLEILK